MAVAQFALVKLVPHNSGSRIQYSPIFPPSYGNAQKCLLWGHTLPIIHHWLLVIKNFPLKKQQQKNIPTLRYLPHQICALQQPRCNHNHIGTEISDIRISSSDPVQSYLKLHSTWVTDDPEVEELPYLCFSRMLSSP